MLKKTHFIYWLKKYCKRASNLIFTQSTVQYKGVFLPYHFLTGQAFCGITDGN